MQRRRLPRSSYQFIGLDRFDRWRLRLHRWGKSRGFSSPQLLPAHPNNLPSLFLDLHPPPIPCMLPRTLARKFPPLWRLPRAAAPLAPGPLLNDIRARGCVCNQRPHARPDPTPTTSGVCRSDVEGRVLSSRCKVSKSGQRPSIAKLVDSVLATSGIDRPHTVRSPHPPGVFWGFIRQVYRNAKG